MTDPAILEELRAVREQLAQVHAEVRRVRAALAQGTGTLTETERHAVDTIGDVLGPAAYTSRELLDKAGDSFGDRPALRAALQAVARDLDAQSIGTALRSIAARGGVASRWRLTSADLESGSRVWVVGPSGG